MGARVPVLAEGREHLVVTAICTAASLGSLPWKAGSWKQGGYGSALRRRLPPRAGGDGMGWCWFVSREQSQFAIIWRVDS